MLIIIILIIFAIHTYGLFLFSSNYIRCEKLETPSDRFEVLSLDAFMTVRSSS
uniref:Uncharacterized protein n=1 Tax=Rhizophora mucronata TaxID=61149 RepID=A0A2P2MCY9_RHIMU